MPHAHGRSRRRRSCIRITAPNSHHGVLARTSFAWDYSVRWERSAIVMTIHRWSRSGERCRSNYSIESDGRSSLNSPSRWRTTSRTSITQRAATAHLNISRQRNLKLYNLINLRPDSHKLGPCNGVQVKWLSSLFSVTQTRGSCQESRVHITSQLTHDVLDLRCTISAHGNTQATLLECKPSKLCLLTNLINA